MMRAGRFRCWIRLAWWPALVLSLLPGSARAATAAAAPPGPDILILAIDTLRGDHLHCAGANWLATDAIDKLAADGIRFANCQATSSWTLPSFASVYTGLLPYRHGVIGGAYQVLAEDQTTLAEYLTDAGYATAACVSIHFLTESYGMRQGFQRFEHCNSPKENGERAACVTANGNLMLRDNHATPFFLLLHYYDIHAPYEQPAPFQGMYYSGDPRAEGVSVVPFLLSEKNRAHNKRSGIYEWLHDITDLTYPVRQYAAGVTFEDSHIGRIIENLQAMGLYDDMLIVLVSDHGEHLGEHDIYFTHYLPYQETLHVPLIVKLPQGRLAGTVLDDPVSIADVLPTIMELAGLPVPPHLDGQSLCRLIESGRSGSPRCLAAEWGADPAEYAKAVVQWPWKLLARVSGGEAWGELYDLQSDPGELRDQSARRPEVLERLRAGYRRIFAEGQPLLSDERPRPAELDTATIEKLRSLGYVE